MTNRRVRKSARAIRILARTWPMFVVSSFLIFSLSCRTSPDLQQNSMPDNAGSNFQLGYRSLYAGKYDEAIRFLKTAILEDPTGDCGTGIGGRAYSELGYAYTLKFDFDNAFQNFDIADEYDKRLIAAYTSQNNYFDKTRMHNAKYSDTVVSMTKLIGMLEVDSRSAPCYFARGHAYQMLGNRTLAIRDFNTFLSLVGEESGSEAIKSYARKQIKKLSEN